MEVQNYTQMGLSDTRVSIYQNIAGFFECVFDFLQKLNTIWKQKQWMIDP